MRLARIDVAGGTTAAVIVDDHAVPIDFPDVGALLSAGAEAVEAVRRAIPQSRHRLPLATVRLRAPISRPSKLLGIGLNYRDHIAERGLDVPSHQSWFVKHSTCVVGPGDAIEVPPVSTEVDYEGELGVVVGRRCRHVPAERWRDVVAGFVVVNDVTARDWTRRAPTLTLGKGFDTHGPLGPWLVTSEEIEDPHDLRITTELNGRVVQDGWTGDMVFRIPEQLAVLSSTCTLEPGDVLATGTPAGVGMAGSPPRFLTAGDMVRVTVEGIGALENPVMAGQLPGLDH